MLWSRWLDLDPDTFIHTEVTVAVKRHMLKISPAADRHKDKQTTSVISP